MSQGLHTNINIINRVLQCPIKILKTTFATCIKCTFLYICGCFLLLNYYHVMGCFLYFSSNDNRMKDSEEEGNTKRPLVTTLHKQEDKQRKFTAYVAVQCRIGKKTDLSAESVKNCEYHAFARCYTKNLAFGYSFHFSFGA